jgi:hypothetical protein
MGNAICNNRTYVRVHEEPFIHPTIEIDRKIKTSDLDAFVTQYSGRKIIGFKTRYFESGMFVVNYLQDKYCYSQIIHNPNDNNFYFILVKVE